MSIIGQYLWPVGYGLYTLDSYNIHKTDICVLGGHLTLCLVLLRVNFERNMSHKVMCPIIVLNMQINFFYEFEK